MTTELVIVLDRSGSMASIKSDMEGGLRQLVRDQKKVEGECNLTLVQFDTDYQVMLAGVPIQTVDTEGIHLTPRGMTALLDAMGRTIGSTTDRIQNMNPKPKVIFVTITDGLENSSREITKPQLNKLIADHEDWEFVYLGANQDAISVGEGLGVASATSVTFDASAVGATMDDLSSKMSAVRSGMASNMAYTAEERARAGGKPSGSGVTS